MLLLYWNYTIKTLHDKTWGQVVTKTLNDKTCEHAVVAAVDIEYNLIKFDL